MNRKEKNGNEYPLPITPNWNEIVATKIIEKPTLDDDCRLKIPTNHGVLYFSILKDGIRIQSEKQFENDYDLLINESKPFKINGGIFRQFSNFSNKKLNTKNRI